MKIRFPSSLAKTAVQFLLPWIPLAFACFMILRFGVFCPHYDDWSILAEVSDIYTGKAPISSLFQLHSEHNILTARLVMLLCMFQGKGMYQWLTVWHMIMLTGTSLLLLRLLRRTLPGEENKGHRTLMWTMTNLLLFHPLTGTDWDWPCQVTVCNLLFFLVLAVSVLESRWSMTVRLGLAALCSALAILSHGAGFAVPGVVFVWLLLADHPLLAGKGRLKIPALWAGIALVLSLPVIWSILQLPGATASVPENALVAREAAVGALHHIRFFLSLFGSWFALPGIFKPEPSAWIYGLLLLGFSGWLMIRVCFFSGGEARRAATPWMALASFGFAAALLISSHRTGISNACAVRYLPFMIWTLIPLPMLWFWKGRSVPNGASVPRQGDPWSVVLGTVYVGFLLLGAVRGFFDAALWHQFRRQAQAETAFCHLDCFPGFSKVLPPFDTSRDQIRTYSSHLAAQGLLPFPLVSGNELESLSATGYSRPFRIREKATGKVSSAVVASGPQRDGTWAISGYSVIKGPPRRVADTVLITHQATPGAPRRIVALALTSTNSEWFLSRTDRPRDMTSWQASFTPPEAQHEKIEAWSVDIVQRIIQKIIPLNQ